MGDHILYICVKQIKKNTSYKLVTRICAHNSAILKNVIPTRQFLSQNYEQGYIALEICNKSLSKSSAS